MNASRGGMNRINKAIALTSGIGAAGFGDVLPARPVGTEGFKVVRMIPSRALILGSLTPDWDGTWAFVLEPLEGDRTRLVTRYRAAAATGPKMEMMLPIYARVHAFMERKQLRTIKARAEHVHGRRGEQAAAP